MKKHNGSFTINFVIYFVFFLTYSLVEYSVFFIEIGLIERKFAIRRDVKRNKMRMECYFLRLICNKNWSNLNGFYCNGQTALLASKMKWMT